MEPGAPLATQIATHRYTSNTSSSTRVGDCPDATSDHAKAEAHMCTTFDSKRDTPGHLTR